MSNRNEPSPSGTSAGPVTKPGRTEAAEKSTAQPFNDPGRTTTSVGDAGVVFVMVTVAVATSSTPFSGSENLSCTVSPSSMTASVRMGMVTDWEVAGSVGSKVRVPETGV